MHGLKSLSFDSMHYICWPSIDEKKNIKIEIRCKIKFLVVSTEPDKELWNNFIQRLPADFCSFFHSNWLYAECYMYRKVSSFFENTKSLKKYDYFAKQKQNGLKIIGVHGVAKSVKRGLQTFDVLMKLNLWSNKCDLSIILSKVFKPDENVFEQLDSFNNNILVNNIKEIWKCLESAKHTKPVIVEFVNDNAGFELYTDLVLADFLIDQELACKVRFSVKAIPWYVSDVVQDDITWSLDYLNKHESPDVRDLAAKWDKYFKDGKFVTSPIHYFWVSAYEYCKMSEIAADLYQYLSEAHLVIFKGDLNYRKLVGDMKWNPTDDLTKCTGGFRPTNFCSLRTLKSDLICGLPESKAEELQCLDSQWMCTGEYGVIQFVEKCKDN